MCFNIASVACVVFCVAFDLRLSQDGCIEAERIISLFFSNAALRTCVDYLLSEYLCVFSRCCLFVAGRVASKLCLINGADVPGLYRYVVLQHLLLQSDLFCDAIASGITIGFVM